MALHSLYCADVPWRNCSLTHSLWKHKTMAFWLETRQKHGILAKSRHLTKITVSVFPWLSTVPINV